MEATIFQPKRFFLYARKSTDEPERQVLSIEAQLFELREYARKEHISIIQEFVESKTAKAPGREIFNAMITGIEEGKAEGILAWHPDRLARNSVDGGRIIYLVDTGKITALKFPTFWFDPTPQGKFMLSIAFGQSKYYVDNLSENIRRGIRQKLRNGIWPAWAPLGYINDKNKRCIVVDKEKARFIKKAFELYATGEYSLARLRELVNGLGLVGKKGKPLSISNYQYLLKNKVYYGVIEYNGEVHEGKHEPIITKELFDQCQAVMMRKSKLKTPTLKPYVYRGLFRCGECGCCITTETQKGYNYLRCTKRKVHCSQRYVQEDVIALQIKEKLREVAIPQNWMDNCLRELEQEKEAILERQQGTILKLQEELVALEEKLNKLLDLQLSGALSQAEYISKKQQLTLTKKELQEKIENMEHKSTNRFERMIAFVKDCNQAEKVLQQENPALGRDFLKKIGSNFLLTNRTLSITLHDHWKIPHTYTTIHENTPVQIVGSLQNPPTQSVKILDQSNWRRGRDSNPR